MIPPQGLRGQLGDQVKRFFRTNKPDWACDSRLQLLDRLVEDAIAGAGRPVSLARF